MDLRAYPGILDMEFSVGKARGIAELVLVALILSSAWERPEGYLSLSR
jgi:hypothetical protein